LRRESVSVILIGLLFVTVVAGALKIQSIRAELPPTRLDNLIITASDLEAAATRLAQWKNSCGIPSKVLNVSWIYSHYGGVDEPEKIRNCIKDYHSNFKTKYVTIFGDTDKVPIRYVYVPDTIETKIPTDLYYADLNYSWDDNRDGVYGDLGNDTMDGVPDVYVGRIPASFNNTAEDVVTKIIQYKENFNPTDDWVKRIVLAAGESEGNMTSDFSDFVAEYISHTILDKNIVKLYQSFGNLTTGALASQIDEGSFFLNFAGHSGNGLIEELLGIVPEAWIFYWRLFPLIYEGFGWHDALDRTNSLKLPVVVTMSCSSAKVDWTSSLGDLVRGECLGEYFVMNPHGGAIAYFGSTGIAWAPDQSPQYELMTAMNLWVYRVFHYGYTNLGAMWGESISRYVKEHQLNEIFYNNSTPIGYLNEKTVMEFILLGDPTLRIYNGPQTLKVPGDYPTIQSAINDAYEGEAIEIAPGEYHENITIDKSVSLLGEDKATTILDSCRVDVVAYGARISNLTIRNGYYDCISLSKARSCDISENIIDTSYVGILLSNSSFNRVTGNSVTNCSYGILSDQFSSYNTLSSNEISKNGDGILLFDWGYGNIISNNTIGNNYGYGLWIGSSTHYNQILDNHFIRNRDTALFLLGTFSNCITKNYIEYSDNGGIVLQGSSNNTITDNTIAENAIGLLVNLSSNNAIHHNNFTYNTRQAIIQPNSSSANVWDNGYPSSGNYWSDYGGTDLCNGIYQNETGSDGIGDTPYVIDGKNLDRWPFISPYHPRDVAITNVTPMSTTISPSCAEYISVSVENRGEHNETICVDVYANNTCIGNSSIMVPALANGSSTIIWNTVGFAGSYRITAYAELLLGEDDISNNGYSDGVVSVVSSGYFIIVAGNRRDNDLLSGINYGCNQVYRILKDSGFSSDNIYYMNQPECGYQDVDGDGKNDIDAWASSSNLQWVIETWAASRVGPAQPLFLYLFDHGGSDVFAIDDPDLLYSSQLATWLDNLETATGAPICVIYAACHSGSFIDDLSRTGRVVVTSCRLDEFSFTLSGGVWEAFSMPFWNYIKSGHSVGSSFNYAYSIVAPKWFWQYWWPWSARAQTPLLDDNGDGIGHGGPIPNGGDGYLANNLHIATYEWPYPWISHTMPRLHFGWPPPSNITLWAEVENKTRLVNVTAWMLPPDWTPPNSTDSLISMDLEHYEMSDLDKDGNWTVTLSDVNFTNHSTGPGNFTFFITAVEENGNQATPVIATVQFTESSEPLNDTISPIVCIERPLEGQSVFGRITVNGTALDDVCLDRVEIYVDGNLSGTIELLPSSNSFFEFSLDTTAFENGNRSIMAKVFDKSGNSGNQTLSLVVNNFIHDVAATNLAVARTIAYRGTCLELNVTIANHGSYAESFNCTVNANSTVLASQQVILSVGNYSTLCYRCNTTSLVCGKLTIIAFAECVSGETNTGDNAITTSIMLTIAGDIKGDFVVDIYDAILLANAFNSRPSSPNWNLNADINGDNMVDIYDAIILANHFNEHYP